MSNSLGIIARKFLPAAIRKPLGNTYGKFREYLLLPFEGLIFDLGGGRFKANGCIFIIPKNVTRLSFRSCFLDNSYEIDERTLVQKFVQGEDSVLELGACLGIVSCITNRILHNPVRHVVVEANPRCLPALQCNRDLNACSFRLEHCAVSNEQEVTFYLHPKYIVGGTAQVKSTVPVRVPGKSLPELYNQHGPFSVLIMDIEGAELETLKVSAALLKDFRLIIIELHEWIIGAKGVAECREILAGAGFKMAGSSYITEAWSRS
jgi:FkbM family methyltransferase